MPDILAIIGGIVIRVCTLVGVLLSTVIFTFAAYFQSLASTLAPLTSRHPCIISTPVCQQPKQSLPIECAPISREHGFYEILRLLGDYAAEISGVSGRKKLTGTKTRRGYRWRPQD